MIKYLAIYSSKSKEILKEYKPNLIGLNIILGERNSSNDETNGVGKTSFVKVLHYILGQAIEEKILNNKEIINREIQIFADLKVRENDFRIARSLFLPDESFVFEGSTKSYDTEKWKKKNSNEYRRFIQNIILGDKKDIPSFASIREYMIRDEKKQFHDILLSNRSANLNHRVVNYLFGLPCNYEKNIDAEKKILSSKEDRIKTIKSISENKTALNSKKRRVNAEIKKLEKSLRNVELNTTIEVDENSYIENKSKLQNISDEIFKLSHIKKQYQRNIDNLEEKIREIKGFNDLGKFFEQINVAIPEIVISNKDEIETFYDKMLDSRGKYFRNNIETIESEIETLLEQKRELSTNIQKVSKILVSKTVIDDIQVVNNRIIELNKNLADIEYKLELLSELKKLTSDINKIKQKIITLSEQYDNEFEEYEKVREQINEEYCNLTNLAYDVDGLLDFEYENNTDLKHNTGRLKITCEVPEQDSHGRYYMRINFFDLTWFLRNLKFGNPINLLVHDGSYVKPDKNIVIKILKEVSNRILKEKSGQYFVTLNIDDLDKQSIANFESRNQIIMKLSRSDKDEKRFFGFKY